jgi:hypothetical protein
MDVVVEIGHIRIARFKVLNLEPPVSLHVSYSNGVFTVDNNKYGISVASENLQKIIDGAVEQLKSLMVQS